MKLEDITPIILTANCEHNLELCLNCLDFASRIVVIDSGSNDRTLDICRSNPKVEVQFRTFDHHATQRSFGLDQVKVGWALCLDSDYRISPQLLNELVTLPESDLINAYEVNFAYCIFGKALRRNLMPPRLLLARAGKLLVVADGHAERFSVFGNVGKLKERILHDDRKPIERWLQRQIFYARMEARKLAKPNKAFRWQDKIRRRASIAPILVFLYLLIYRGMWRDGWQGFYYTIERTVAELILILAILEHKFVLSAGNLDE